MTDARWIDVLDDMTAAVRHFSAAGRIFGADAMTGEAWEAYVHQMAFLHAMESGYSALEAGLERILDILREERPTGSQYHADLIRRLGREIPGRPRLFDDEMVHAVDLARRFRHGARTINDGLDLQLALPAVRATDVLIPRLIPAVEAFRHVIDPD